MLQFRNRTPFTGTILLLSDPDGIESLYTIVKATFTLGDPVALADTQAPVAMAPEHYGAPDRSSIRVPSDVSLMKPGTDILMLGHAYAPGGRPASEMEVSLSVGPISKRVRVFGDRVWRSSRGWSMSAPAMFETMPLVWERAYGGADTAAAAMRAETRNPVGLGFAAPSGDEDGAEFHVPNLEDPAQLISSLKQQPRPACFAPLAPHWEPRRSYAGTYDDRWQQERAPYLPADFDPWFFQLAPHDQVAVDHLRGGEAVEVRGATPSGLLRFRLPIVELSIDCVLDRQSYATEPVLDTVIVEPDEDRLQLVWRAVFPCDKKALRVSEVRVSLAGLPAA